MSRRDRDQGRQPGTGVDEAQPARRLGRRRADRLLDGAGSPSDPLQPWLSAVRAGAVSTEFADEEQQLAGFRAAHAAREIASPAPKSGRRITRMKAVVAAVVASGAAGVTGVAVAGAAGVLPARLQRPAHNIFHAPAPASTARPSHSPGGSTSRTSPSGRGSSTSATTSPGQTSAPTSTSAPSAPSGSSPSRPQATTPATTTPADSERSTATTSSRPSTSVTVTTKPSRTKPSQSRKPDVGVTPTG